MNNIKNFFLEINLNEKHKKLTQHNSVYFFGGVIILIALFLTSISVYFKLFCILIYILGLLSDKKYLFSPNLRLILQSSIIMCSIYFLDIRILQTRIDILDDILKLDFFSFFFTAFCLLILINGSNFIDGINCNLITYYLLITGIIFLIKGPNINFNLSNIDLYIIISSLIIILIFNLMGKITSGDGGAYLVSFFWGVNLINFSEDNNFVSPFFVVLILWYPAFENLFSIIRKLKLKKSALNADFKHLHQLIFLLIKTKIKNKNLANNYSGLIISFYNLIIFYLSFKFYHHTQTLIIITIFNIFIYLIIYFRILSVFKIIAKKH